MSRPRSLHRTVRVGVGPKFSEGSRLLWSAKVRLGLSQAGMSETLGVRKSTFSRWLYGERVPDADFAAGLRDAFGIPVEAWSLRPRRPFRTPADERSRGAA